MSAGDSTAGSLAPKIFRRLVFPIQAFQCAQHIANASENSDCFPSSSPSLTSWKCKSLQETRSEKCGKFVRLPFPPEETPPHPPSYHRPPARSLWHLNLWHLFRRLPDLASRWEKKPMLNECLRMVDRLLQGNHTIASSPYSHTMTSYRASCANQPNICKCQARSS